MLGDGNCCLSCLSPVSSGVTVAAAAVVLGAASSRCVKDTRKRQISSCALKGYDWTRDLDVVELEKKKKSIP